MINPLKIRMPTTVLRWLMWFIATLGTIALLVYVLPWVTFWAIHALFGVQIAVSVKTVAALWVLLLTLRFQFELVNNKK